MTNAKGVFRHHHDFRYSRFLPYTLFPFVVVLWALTVFPPSAPAAVSQVEQAQAFTLTPEETAWLTRHGDDIPLWFSDNFPPVEFMSGKGRFIGMGADVIALIEKQIGITFKKTVCKDWNRHLEALASGECAIAPVIVRTEERTRFAFFTTPYAVVPVVIITTRSRNGQLTLADFTDKRIAVVSGYATEKYLETHSPGTVTRVAVPDVAQGLRAVSFGQVDAFIANLAVAAYYIDQEGISNLRVAGDTPFSFAFSIGISKKYPLLHTIIEKAVLSLPKKDLEAINQQWISLQGNQGWSKETIQYIKLTAFFIVLLVLCLIVFNVVLKSRLRKEIDTLNATRKELLDQTEWFRLAMEATEASLWDYDPIENCLQLNDTFYKMLAYPPGPSKISIETWKRYFHPDDFIAAERVIEEYIAAGGIGEFKVEFRLKKADNTWCWILGKGRAVGWDELGHPTRMIGFNLNIQEIKEVRDQLASSEAKFRAIFDHAPYAIVINDISSGRLIDANQVFLKSKNIRKEDLPQIDPTAYYTAPKETSDKIVDHILKHGRINDVETTVRQPDGSLKHIIYSSVLLELEGKKQILSMTADVTNWKKSEAEREKLQEQLMQSQKLEAVGILAGGVAHDFNNMLGAIIGYAELTLDEMDTGNPFRKNLGQILDAAERSADLTRQLLAFSRQQSVSPVVFDLNESVEAMLAMMRRLIGENIDLVWMPGHSNFPVKMDPSQLDQILVNLCVNAKDAITDVGKITIETDVACFDDTNVPPENLKPGTYVMLSVIDDGCGMDPNTAAHVFEPFFSTKKVGQGTGLGLATVYGIVKQHDGFIRLYSEAGLGTTFRIYFPQHVVQPSAPKPDTLESIPHGHGETILMVEDDPHMRKMGMVMLERLGYTVLPAATPGEAINISKDETVDIDLFITDVVMPEMNGRELMDKLQAIRPGTRYVFISGYTSDIILDRGVAEAGCHFIQKPFTLKALANKVHALIHRETGD